MDSTRFMGIESNFKDFPTSQRPVYLNVNIAIVDSSPGQPLPILYILKRDLWDADLAIPQQDLETCLGKDPLIPKGPVLMVDRQQKRLYLADNSVLMYNHLVTFTSPKFGDRAKYPDDCISHGAVQTLIDALRCLPIRPPEPSRQQKPSSPHRICLSQSHLHETKILDCELLKRLNVPQTHTEVLACTAQLCSSDHWLFEVQT